MKRAKRAIKGTSILFIVSLIIISLLGGYLGVKGNQVPYKFLPAQAYEEISFGSQARDKISLHGWYLPAQAKKTAILVHGWGGHRARTLDLAEYLQRSGINVLTFDLRGGSGRNSYGQHESGDLAGAIDWLKQEKQMSDADIAVIGMSMGAAATTIYASTHSVASIVLLGPIIDIKAAKQSALKNLHFILPSMYAAGGTFVEHLFFGVRPINPINVFQDITSPTLIMHANNDTIAPTASAHLLQEQTQQRNQNNITFDFLGDVGHKFIDTDKELGYPYGQRIVTFIQNH